MLLRLALLTAIGATSLVAQTEPPTGLAAISFAAGGGSGAVNLPCTGCPATYRAPTHSARVWMARIAFANTPQSFLGVEYDNWQRSTSVLVTDPVTLDQVPVEQTTTVTWINATVQWYPFTRRVLSGLYAKGALGLTSLELSPATKVKSTGGGAGLGWDIWLTKLLAVTPSYDVLAAQRAKLPVLGRRPLNTPVTSVGAFMTSFGLALKFKGIP